MAWDNLWKAFVLLPGTEWPRIALVIWELILWTIVGIGVLVGVSVSGCGRRISRGVVFTTLIGLLLGGATAFLTHELVFKWWVNTVVGIPDADDGDVVGRDHRAILTLERWIGPVR